MPGEPAHSKRTGGIPRDPSPGPRHRQPEPTGPAGPPVGTHGRIARGRTPGSILVGRPCKTGNRAFDGRRGAAKGRNLCEVAEAMQRKQPPRESTRRSRRPARPRTTPAPPKTMAASRTGNAGRGFLSVSRKALRGSPRRPERRKRETGRRTPRCCPGTSSESGGAGVPLQAQLFNQSETGDRLGERRSGEPLIDLVPVGRRPSATAPAMCFKSREGLGNLDLLCEAKERSPDRHSCSVWRGPPGGKSKLLVTEPHFDPGHDQLVITGIEPSARRHDSEPCSRARPPDPGVKCLDQAGRK